jgi:hypothetical protein
VVEARLALAPRAACCWDLAPRSRRKALRIRPAAQRQLRKPGGDSDALQQNYLTPGLSGGSVTTVDGTTSFKCQHRDKNGPGTGLKRGQLG